MDLSEKRYSVDLINVIVIFVGPLPGLVLELTRARWQSASGSIWDSGRGRCENRGFEVCG